MVRARTAETDAEAATGSTPERTCVVTRAKLSPAELIRFVRAPDGTITPDLAARLPGKGVWVVLDRVAVEMAAAQNAFTRSLKRPVSVPAGLADLVDRLIAERCVQALALANKAGLVVAGFAKVEAAIVAGRLAALVHAADASPDGCAKLDGRLRARFSLAGGDLAIDAQAEDRSIPAVAHAVPGGPLIVTDLGGSELSLALGRENVVHAAVIQGGAARYFLTEVQRLRRYRSSTSAAAARPPRTRSNTEQA